MQVEIIKTRQGSPNGYDVKTYKEGEVCDMPDALAKVFLKQKWAKKAVPENKDNGGSSDNKMSGVLKMKEDAVFILDDKSKLNFEKGKEYKVPGEMPEAVAEQFIKAGTAEPVNGKNGFMVKMKSFFTG